MKRLYYFTLLITITLTLNVKAQDLDGTCWDNLTCDGTTWLTTCFEDGIMTSSVTNPPPYINFLTAYGIDSLSGNLWFVDISGSCGADTGYYSYEIIDGMMTFTSIDDPCAPREANLTCFVFTEQEAEIYEDVLDGTCWNNQSCDNAFWFVTCFEDGIMTSSIDSLGLSFMTNYGIDSLSGNLWFVDISGSCGADTGWYSFEIIDYIMTFTSIDDPCAGRETNLNCLEFISPSVGIAEIEKVSEVLVYPNPTSGHVNLAFENNKGLAIKVYALDGKIIYQKENINGANYEFDLEGVDGIYILEISNQNDRRRYKIVKN